MNADLKLPLIDLEGDNNPTGRKVKTNHRERLSEEGYMYCVYWIHTQAHKDILTEGYVGITKDFTARMRSHKKNRKLSPLNSAIKKYGKDNLVYETILEGLSLEAALAKELELRPGLNVGWNLQKGGELGVDSSWYEVKENQEAHSKATSEATRKGIKTKDTTEARANRARDNWKNSPKYIGVSRGSRNPKAILNEEKVHEIKYTHIPAGLSNQEIAALYGVKHYVICFIRNGKNWSYI